MGCKIEVDSYIEYEGIDSHREFIEYMFNKRATVALIKKVLMFWKRKGDLSED